MTNVTTAKDIGMRAATFVYIAGLALLLFFFQRRVEFVSELVEGLHETATHNLWILSFLIAALGLALVLLQGFTYQVAFSSVTLIPITLSIWATWFGRIQLSTYDASSLIDLAWRLNSGQSPGSDFPNTLPPVHIILSKLSWIIFGHRWTSFTWLSLICTIIFLISSIFAWVYYSRNRSSSQIIVLTSLMVIPHVVIGHLWHSSTTALIAVATSCWLIAVMRNTISKPIHCIFGIHLALLICAKPNIGLPMALILVGLCILTLWRNWVALSRVFGCMFIGASLIFYVSGINIRDYVHTVIGLAGSRSTPNMLFPEGNDRYFQNRLTTLYLSCTILLLIYGYVSLSSLIRKHTSQWLELMVGVGTFIVGLFGMATNWDIKESSIPLTLFGLLIFSSVASRRYTNIPRREIMTLPLLILMTWVLLSSFMLGASRWRMELTGPMFQRGVTNEFQGAMLHEVKGSPLLHAVVEQTQKVLEAENPKSVFFGPRMEFLYSQFEIKSPIGLPIWWHEGTSYLASDFSAINRTFEQQKFDILIFFKNDYTRFPGSLLQFISLNYTKDEAHSQLTLFRLTSSK
jgi:hypothetical protein